MTVRGDTVLRVDLDGPAPKETRAELSRILADRFSADEARKAKARKLLADCLENRGVDLGAIP